MRNSKSSKDNKALLLCLVILASCFHSPGVDSKTPPQKEKAAQSAVQKWIRVGGYWKVENSRAVEQRGRSSYWRYHELMNYNTLVTSKAEGDFTEISTRLSLFNVKVLPVEAMLVFAVRSPYKHYYYNFYAVKFSGDANGINKVSIVHSRRKDPSASYRTKNNFTVDTLYSEECRLQFWKDYNIRVEKKGEKIALYIDDKKIFREKLPTEDLKGKFAVSSRGASIGIDYFSVVNNGAPVFRDDFDYDSIKVFRVKARKIKK